MHLTMLDMKNSYTQTSVTVDCAFSVTSASSAAVHEQTSTSVSVYCAPAAAEPSAAAAVVVAGAVAPFAAAVAG